MSEDHDKATSCKPLLLPDNHLSHACKSCCVSTCDKLCWKITAHFHTFIIPACFTHKHFLVMMRRLLCLQATWQRLQARPSELHLATTLTPTCPAPPPPPPPSFSPSPTHQTPAPQSSLFKQAASPATIPAKRVGFGAGTAAASTSALDTGIPAMFSSGTGREAAFASTEDTGKFDPLLANKGVGVDKSGSEHDDEHKESAKPAAAASGWGASFLKVPHPLPSQHCFLFVPSCGIDFMLRRLALHSCCVLVPTCSSA